MSQRTGLFNRNTAQNLAIRNRALSGTNENKNTNSVGELEAVKVSSEETSKSLLIDSPASLNASFVKDQDGFDDVESFFNQASTPQKSPTRKSNSTTPLKANGMVAKPIAMIKTKLAAHYSKEPRFAVSMSEVAIEAEADGLIEDSNNYSNEDSIDSNDEVQDSTNLHETAIESHYDSQAQHNYFETNFDYDDDHSDALMNQLADELLVSDNHENHHESKNAISKNPVFKKPVSKASKAKTNRRVATYFPGAEYDEAGQRRSKRQRMTPLRYWANEKVCYGRAEDPSITLPVIVNVIKKPELDDPTFATGRSGRRRNGENQKNPNSLRLRAQAFGPECDVEAAVICDADGDEVEMRTLALSHHHVDGDSVNGNNFRIHTMFTEGAYMSAGQLLFPAGASKPAKNSARHALVFYVIAGSFEVGIHETSFVIGPGGQFHVPRNNAYSLAHISSDKSVEGRLFFCHCKDNRENE